MHCACVWNTGYTLLKIKKEKIHGLQKSHIKRVSNWGKSTLKILCFKKINSSECGDGLDSLNGMKKMNKEQFFVPYNKTGASN